jgi:hypothetical protein
VLASPTTVAVDIIDTLGEDPLITKEIELEIP